MWKCLNCKMTNDTYKCKNCGLDESKAYTHHLLALHNTQTELVSSNSRQVPVPARGSSRKNDCRTSRKNSGGRKENNICSPVQELAALGEDQYQLKIWEDETIDPDINRYCSMWEAKLSFAAIAETEAQLQLSEDYREASSKNEAFVRSVVFDFQ